MTKCLRTTTVLFVFYFYFETNGIQGLDWPFVNREHRADGWEGRWFPYSPNREDDNPSVEYGAGAHADLHDSKHGIRMGVPTNYCDDGKINLTVDWDNSPVNYTCFEDKAAYLPKLDVHPSLHCDHIPAGYNAPHKCMNMPITYEDDIPTFGAHRPLWPRYGEYIFVPKQRWLHSLEHGAVVMLYHPCANTEEVQLLRSVVRGCLYRHIITPYQLLEADRPLALVAWGTRLEISKVEPKLAVEFIRNVALQGPEQKYEDGQFDAGLILPAEVVSDKEDHNLCPGM